MRAEIVLFGIFLIFIALTLSACTPQEIAEFDELDEHTKSVLITYTTPQAEPPKMIETFTKAEKTQIINPYFSIKNTTGEIFRVDHEGNFYLYPLINCDTLDTDGSGLLSCGTDDDTTYSHLTNLTDDILWTSGFNATLDSKLVTTYFNATSILVVTGTGQGAIGDLQTYNNLGYNVSEVDSDFDLRINFTGVTGVNQLVYRYKTEEGEPHIMNTQIWDYTDNDWEGYAEEGARDHFGIFTYGIYDEDDHISDGLVQVRFYTTNPPPNTVHKWEFDWITISDGLATPSSSESDPFSVHRDGTTPLTGDWDVGAYNIIVGENLTADYIILEGNTTFKMYANETCWVINVASTYLEVCI